MTEYKLLNDSIIASQDEKGNWIYKSNTENQLKPFKKNGTIKKEYKDLPRFKAIVQYEAKEMKYYDSLLVDSVKEISLKLLSLSR